jgi:serine/threonine-protein kinase
MLTGRPPYTGDTALSVAYRHVNDDVPRPSELRAGIPAALDELIVRATRRDPEARQADAGAFLAELNAVRAELGIPVVPVPVPVPLPPDADRVSDVERTMPHVAAVGTAAPIAGPRGTRALTRVVPVAAPLPPHSPATGIPAPAGPPPSGPLPKVSPSSPAARRKRYLALAAVAVLLGALIGTGAWLLSGNNSDGTVAVPQLVGQTQAVAGSSLRAVKLTPMYPATERHNTVPSGSVIRTDPVAGSQVQPGAEITVVISSGRPTVPDIKPGITAQAAEQAIKDQQLVPTRGSDTYSADILQGAVVSVTPSPGTQLDIGGQVTIQLSKGPSPLPVPSVVGKTKDEAFAALSQAGFDPVQAGVEFSADVAAGSVTRTDPPAGTMVNGASKKINVWVSDAVVVPDVRFKTFDEAQKILAAAGFEVNGTGSGNGNGNRGHGGFSFVFQQSPAPGTRVPQGAQVQLRGIG